MVVRQVVLDFDGTCTHVDKEAVPFVAGYKNGLAVSLEIPLVDLERLWDQTQRNVHSQPQDFGWRDASTGVIIAPAYADPLVESRTIADFILTHDFAMQYSDSKVRDALLERLFQENYRKQDICFKDETPAFFSGLSALLLDADNALSGICIVTNSRTTDVERKLEHLSPGTPTYPVHGNAKKYVLDQSWNHVPEVLCYNQDAAPSLPQDVPGFGRPIYLRRKNYGDLLARIMEQDNLAPEEVVVVGDIFELDLALPLQLGMHGIFVRSSWTPVYEENLVGHCRKGYVAATLSHALGTIVSLSKK